MNELYNLIEKELLADIENNLGFWNPPFSSKNSTNPWYEQTRLALGLSHGDDCAESATTCTKSKMPFLSTELVAYTIQANGKDPYDFIPVLAGVFLIQQASSILDDIQDRDREDSLDRLLNLPTALNLALLMLSRGQEIIATTLAQQSLQNQACTGYLNLVAELHRAIVGALQGQLLDLQETKTPLVNRAMTVAQYVEKMALKSGSRFSFLAGLGALLGESPELVDCYRQFGYKAGIALNLLSDLYDFMADGLGRDYKSGVFNLPLLYLYQNQGGETDRQAFLLQWEQSLTASDYVAPYQGRETAMQQSVEQINRYIAEAEEVLRKLDPALENPAHVQLLWLLRQHLAAPAMAE